jgi:hypothetical protein
MRLARQSEVKHTGSVMHTLSKHEHLQAEPKKKEEKKGLDSDSTGT